MFLSEMFTSWMATSHLCKCLRHRITSHQACCQGDCSLGREDGSDGSLRGPRSQGRVDGASWSWARDKARPQETVVRAECDWAIPIFQTSDTGHVSMATRRQKSLLVAVYLPGTRQNFKMENHPSTLAVGLQHMHKMHTYPTLSRACIPESGCFLNQCHWVPVEELSTVPG